MKYSNYSLFSSDHAHKGLEYAIKHTLDLGFDAVEHIENVLTDGAKLSNANDTANMKKLLSDSGLTVSCYSLLVDLLSEGKSAIIDRAYRHIEYAAELGSPFVHHTLVPGYDLAKKVLSYDEALKRISDDAEKLAKRCNEYGIICLYEPQGLYFNGVAGVRGILEEMKKRGCKVGICGDTGNSIFVDCPPFDIYENFADDIKHIHVKDYYWGKSIAPAKYSSTSGKTIAEAPLGEGDSEISKCLKYLPEYDAAMSFEFLADDAEMKRSIAWVKEITNK